MLTYPRFQVNRLLTVATEFGIHSVLTEMCCFSPVAVGRSVRCHAKRAHGDDRKNATAAMMKSATATP